MCYTPYTQRGRLSSAAAPHPGFRYCFILMTQRECFINRSVSLLSQA